VEVKRTLPVLVALVLFVLEYRFFAKAGRLLRFFAKAGRLRFHMFKIGILPS
jgi:hypothetical protein